MFNKKYLMLSIFLLSLLTLSVVSASDNATEVISLEESNDAISIGETQAIGQSEDDTLMEPDGGTFSDLQRKIDNANASSTITLENNYTYDDGFNKEGILISKEITIEGNGYTIDGKEVSRIFNVTSTGVVFKNIIFTNGHAEGNGGAISGNATAIGCTFYKNYANGDGGAVYNVNAVNCTFTGNHVNHNGGGIYNGNATDCNFKGNEAFKGGGIYNGTATNCMFVNNVAKETYADDGDGGAMFGGAAYYCTFDSNYAHDDCDGAALSHSYAENCIFIKNHAADCGGAIYYTSAVNCNFTENTASGTGGAIYHGDATNCIFERNSLDGDGEEGGAICNGNAYNCHFTGNKAFHGGAMHSSGYAENCTFIANSADGGGALYHCNAKNCVFINCSSSDDGGAFYFGDAENCIFTGNKANSEGGAIYQGNARNCTFEGNSAMLGGAMYTDEHARGKQANDCRFINNKATSDTNNDAYGGGAICGIAAYNCYFENNAAKCGGAINAGYLKEHSKKNVEVRHCTFVNNKASDKGAVAAYASLDVCIIKGGEKYNDLYETSIRESYISTYSHQTELNRGDALHIEIVHDDHDPIEGVEVFIHVTDFHSFDKTFSSLSGEDWIIDLPKSGQYNIKIDIPDAIGLNGFSENITIDSQVNMTTNDISTTYGEDGSYVITLRDKFNNPISNVTVNVDIIDAKDYTTDENGQINISIKDLKPGTYTAKATFDNIKYDQVININNIFIDKQAVMLMPNTLVTTYNSNDVVRISIYDNKNKPIKNITLSVDLNGTKNYTTDKQGQIEISPKGLIPDTYLIDVVFEGNEIYHNSKSTGKVIIQKDFTKLIANTMIATYNDGKELTITLTDGYDNPIREASIVVDLDGSKKYTTDKNGQIKISHEDLTPNTYEVNVTFKGNDLFKESETATTLVINKIGANINIDSLTNEYIFAKDYVIIMNDDDGNPAGNVSIVLDLNGTKEFTTDENGQIKFNIYEDDKTMIISINDDLGNPLKNVKLSVNLNGTKEYNTDSKGQIKVSTAAFAPGTYPVDVAFGGNEIYSESNATAKLTVIKCTTKLTANRVSTKYGENNDLIVILKDNHGNPINDVQVSVDLNGVENYTTDNEGQINVSTSKLAPGTYIAKIHFGEDDYCFGCDMETIVEVKKSATQIIASSVETTYNSGVFLPVYLKDIDGHPITNGSLSVDLDGVENYTTDEYGEIILSTSGLTPGNHTVMIEFRENDYYIGSSNEIYINIEKSETTLIADAVETDYGINKNLFITLKDDDCVPIINASVSVDLNGLKNYTTDENGQIRIPIQNMTPGKYVAKISFEAKYYIASSIETSVVINKIESKLTANSVATTYGINEDLIIKLTDSDSNPIANATVSVELDSIKKYTTNEKGQITIPSNSITPGRYIAKISINDKYHKSSTVETAVVVNKIATKLTANNVTTTYKVNKKLIISLKDSDDNPMQNISVSVDLGGVKDYTTDEKGQINIPVQKLVPKTYVAKIKFNGNSHYIESETADVVVIKKATPKIGAKAKKFKAKSKSKKYTIKLKNNKKQAMKKVKVYLKVKGKTYAAKTNSKGKATFKITKLTKKGKFNAVITYKGNKYYKKVTKKTKITIM